MKTQVLVALMLAVLSQTANAQAIDPPGGPIGTPPATNTTGQPPTLPLGPKVEVPNPDQPPVLVCVAPVATTAQLKQLRVMVADREAKSVAITLQSKGSVDYYDRLSAIKGFTKSGDCLEYKLLKTFRDGDTEEGTLEVDLTRNMAMVTSSSGKGVPTVFPSCKIFNAGDYLKIGNWIRGQL